MKVRAGARGAEVAFLERYRPSDFVRPAVAVDPVILTVKDSELRVLLVQRAEHPFKERWALPGGFLRVSEGRSQGEDLDAAAHRELEEETGLKREHLHLEQLGAFGAPGRDPRMRVISIAYLALVRPDLIPLVRPGGDARRARWFEAFGVSRSTLAFDHRQILDAAIERLRRELDRSRVAFSLVAETFTIPELRRVHAVISGAVPDPGNFRRKVQRLLEDGEILPADGKRITARKPASVYRLASSAPPRSAGSRVPRARRPPPGDSGR